MRQTVFVTIAALLLICLGLGIFYTVKIRPLQQELTFSEENSRMYQEISLNKQKTKSTVPTIDHDVLPEDPEIETFFVAFHKQAAAHQVTIQSINRSSPDNKEQRAQALAANSLDITLAANDPQQMISLLRDLEKMKRALTINQLTLQSSGKEALLNLTLYSQK